MTSTRLGNTRHIHQTPILPMRNNSNSSSSSGNMATRRRRRTTIAGPVGAPDVVVRCLLGGLSALDTSIRRECGRFKCFFPSRDDPAVGYLISSSTRARHQLQSMQRAHEMALDVERRFGIRHALLAEPYEIGEVRVGRTL